MALTNETSGAAATNGNTERGTATGEARYEVQREQQHASPDGNEVVYLGTRVRGSNNSGDGARRTKESTQNDDDHHHHAEILAKMKEVVPKNGKLVRASRKQLASIDEEAERLSVQLHRGRLLGLRLSLNQGFRGLSEDDEDLRGFDVTPTGQRWMAVINAQSRSFSCLLRQIDARLAKLRGQHFADFKGDPNLLYDSQGRIKMKAAMYAKGHN